MIAIKVPFGELGNTAFINPVLLRPVIEELKRIKTNPFLTDTNTLYTGMRGNSVNHLHNAFLNGFNYSTLQVPVIIADGLRGENTVEIDINLELVKKVKLAGVIVNSNGMIVVSHFKGHENAGFGGAIKNLSMGCASRQGKLEMHSQTRPYVDRKCSVCGKCISNCQVDAIVINHKAFITNKCIGCGRCITICPENAINVNWTETTINKQKKMVEYAYGIGKIFNSKIIYLNILTSISPGCDCNPYNDAPIVPDIGYLASIDPVALDKASYDLVIKQMGYDPFKKEYPHIDFNTQFEYSKKINFGNLEYELINVDDEKIQEFESESYELIPSSEKNLNEAWFDNRLYFFNENEIKFLFNIKFVKIHSGQVIKFDNNSNKWLECNIEEKKLYEAFCNNTLKEIWFNNQIYYINKNEIKSLFNTDVVKINSELLLKYDNTNCKWIKCGPEEKKTYESQY